MTGNLRDVLFDLLGGVSTLALLEGKLRADDMTLSEQEKRNMRAMIDFLRKIQIDTHLYLSGQQLTQQDLSGIFVNFLTGLLFAQDKRLTKGPAYAVANVALDNSDWTQVIREFNFEHEQLLDKRIDTWISLLEELLGSRKSNETQEQLSQMLILFEKTASLLEQA